jgi:tagatose-1,6-bisphosphate aldolase non-catalytic subunit AgaZ/GatZ
MGACGAPVVQHRLVDPQVRLRSTAAVSAILDVLQSYEDAVEALDLAAVHQLVSIDYYENAGTTDTTADDYGFVGVLPALTTLREHLREVRLRIIVRDLVVETDRAEVIFDFELTMLYQVGDHARWHTGRDVSRMQLQLEEDGAWRFTSGL